MNVGQTEGFLTAYVDEDITGATAAKIKFTKPDSTPGEFTATIVSESPKGKLRYDIASAGDLDQAGVWTFWSYIEFNGDWVAGDPYEVEIKTEGT